MSKNKWLQNGVNTERSYSSIKLEIALFKKALLPLIGWLLVRIDQRWTCNLDF